MVIVLSLFMGYHLGIEPGTDRLKTVKNFSREARAIVPAGAEIVFHNNFNTELIFFMDRPYRKEDDENFYRFLASHPAGELWCLSSPKAVKKLHEKQPGVWKEHLRTPQDHQYPAVLLERRGGTAGNPGK